MTKWSELRGRSTRGPACPRCGAPMAIARVLHAVFDRWGHGDVFCERCRTTARITWQSRLGTHAAAMAAMLTLMFLTADHLPWLANGALALAAYFGTAAACTPWQRWRATALPP